MIKKILGAIFILGSILSLSRGRSKPDSEKPSYTRKTSDREYVEIEPRYDSPDFRHPNDRTSDGNIIRSPDGSA